MTEEKPSSPERKKIPEGAMKLIRRGLMAAALLGGGYIAEQAIQTEMQQESRSKTDSKGDPLLKYLLDTTERKDISEVADVYAVRSWEGRSEGTIACERTNTQFPTVNITLNTRLRDGTLESISGTLQFKTSVIREKLRQLLHVPDTHAGTFREVIAADPRQVLAEIIPLSEDAQFIASFGEQRVNFSFFKPREGMIQGVAQTDSGVVRLTLEDIPQVTGDAFFEDINSRIAERKTKDAGE